MRVITWSTLSGPLAAAVHAPSVAEPRRALADSGYPESKEWFVPDGETGVYELHGDAFRPARGFEQL